MNEHDKYVPPSIRPPAFGEIVMKNQNTSVRVVIENLMRDPKCWHDIEPFFINGGITGHKVMDLKGAVDVLRSHDKDRLLVTFDLNDFQLGNKLKGVLRSRYSLDSHWKVNGLNDKRIAYAPKQEV